MTKPKEPRERRHYTQEQKAEATALAVNLGHAQAAEALGIPRRTVSAWTATADMKHVVAQVQADVVGVLVEAHAEALAAVRAGLNDPRQRLADRAKALDILGQQVERALMRPGADEALPVGPVVDMARAIAALDEQKRALLMDVLDRIEASDTLDDLLDPGVDLKTLDRPTLVGLITRLTAALEDR